MICVEVHSNNVLTVRNDSFANAVSDSVKHETVKFLFSDNWKDYQKTAVFSAKGVEPVNILLSDENELCVSNDECYIPFEVLKGQSFTLSVFGVLGDSIATTTKEEIAVFTSGYALGDAPSEPTQNEYSQIIDIMTATKEIAESVRNDADNGLFNGEKGEDGVGVGRLTEQGGEIFNDYVNNVASGEYSHAQGCRTVALGSYSSASGFSTEATHNYQFVVGMNNKNKESTLFEVGNGFNVVETLSNAFEVYKDGHAEVMTVGDTDNSVPTKKYVDDAVANSSDDIPDYWKTALEEGAQAINEKLCIAGSNKSAFLFYSDSHYNYGSQMSPKLLKYLYKHTGITKTNFGGDIVNNEGADYDTMEYLWEWRNQLKDLPNHHSVVGNHDDGNYTNDLFSEQYIYGYLLAAEETPDIVRGDNGMYYYIDNSPEKTRYLYLDTAYKGMTTEQQEFIKQALLTTPDNWHIVVIAHIWYDTIYPDTEAGITEYGVGEISADAKIVTALLDAYNSRTGDFEDCGGKVEFCIGGHTHTDYDGTTETGIPIILVETDSKHVRSGLTYNTNTTSEASVNGVIADYTNRKIYVVRIGRGESRDVEITNYVVSYTNILPLATINDGVTIYNAEDTAGYKADTRWSSSSNAESTSTGIYLTGYIPINEGDVIRLKNITMPNEASNYCVLHMFRTLDDTNEGNINNTNIESYYSPEWDDNGNLTQFTIPSASEYKYVRIQCGGIDDTSIITINESIK